MALFWRNTSVTSSSLFLLQIARRTSGLKLRAHEILQGDARRFQPDAASAIFSANTGPEGLVAIESNDLSGRALQRIKPANDESPQRRKKFCGIRDMPQLIRLFIIEIRNRVSRTISAPVTTCTPLTASVRRRAVAPLHRCSPGLIWREPWERWRDKERQEKGWLSGHGRFNGPDEFPHRTLEFFLSRIRRTVLLFLREPVLHPQQKRIHALRIAEHKTAFLEQLLEHLVVRSKFKRERK